MLLKKDGIWAWAICVSALVSNAIVFGIDGSFGEIVALLTETLDRNVGTVSWIQSIHSSVMLLFASISTIFIQKYGFRVVIVGGTILSCVAYLCAAFTENLFLLILTYGILGGAGSGLLYAPGNIISCYYFEKQRAIATGVAMCGSGVGVACVSLLAHYLNILYGTKGVFIAFSLLSTLSIVLGILAFPIKKEAEHDLNGRSPDVTEPDYKKDIDGGLPVIEESQVPKSVLAKFKLLKDPRLVLYCVVNFMFELSYDIPTTFLPEMMVVDHGLPISVKGTIMAVLGASTIVGKLLSGIMTKLFKRHTIIMSAITMVGLGSGSIGLAFCSTNEAFIGVTIFYGLCFASIDNYGVHILIEMYGVSDQFQDAYGLVTLSKTLASPWGPPIGGALHDLFGAYNVTFYGAGICLIIAAVTNFLVFWIHFKKSKSYQINL